MPEIILFDLLKSNTEMRRYDLEGWLALSDEEPDFAAALVKWMTNPMA